jgi:dihydroorotate dehydrogenase
MGFNNEGHAALRRRLEARAGRAGIVGINLGANKDSADRIGDYVAGIATFSDLASYFTVNISSPNTPNLRALQSRAELTALLTRLNEARAQAGRRPPMLLKIAPDLDDGELRDIASACADGAVDGIVVSNTTLSRQGLRSPLGREGGGLSGRPLAALATRQIAKLHVMTEGRITLVGVGGIHDAASALARIRAGASLLQLYTALVFDGPGLVAEILGGLRDHLAASGQSLQSLRGLDAYQGLSGT